MSTAINKGTGSLNSDPIGGSSLDYVQFHPVTTEWKKYEFIYYKASNLLADGVTNGGNVGGLGFKLLGDTTQHNGIELIANYVGNGSGLNEFANTQLYPQNTNYNTVDDVIYIDDVSITEVTPGVVYWDNQQIHINYETTIIYVESILEATLKQTYFKSDAKQGALGFPLGYTAYPNGALPHVMDGYSVNWNTETLADSDTTGDNSWNRYFRETEATALAGAWINYAPQDGEGLNLPIGGLMGNSRVSASYVIDYYGAPEHYETFNYISYAKVDVIDMATYAGDVKKINLKVIRNGKLGDNWDINLEEVL